MQKLRSEADIFRDLGLLCSSSGYIHVIAYLCWKHNFIQYSGEITPEALTKMRSSERLIRTEISTLIGLMTKEPICFIQPNFQNLSSLAEQTEALLEELHDAISAAYKEAKESRSHLPLEEQENIYGLGAVLREPIFYAAESAYSFQYRDFCIQKYKRDEAWISAKKGFSVYEACKIIECWDTLVIKKIDGLKSEELEIDFDKFTFLPAFIFSIQELVNESGVPYEVCKNVLKAFSMPAAPCKGLSFSLF